MGMRSLPFTGFSVVHDATISNSWQPSPSRNCWALALNRTLDNLPSNLLCRQSGVGIRNVRSTSLFKYGGVTKSDGGFLVNGGESGQVRDIAPSSAGMNVIAIKVVETGQAGSSPCAILGANALKTCPPPATIRLRVPSASVRS